MDAVIMKILDMSISASYLIMAVLLIRLLVSRLPKKFICMLWGLVFVRLVMPFEPESGLSLLPAASPVDRFVSYQNVQHVGSAVTGADGSVSGALSEHGTLSENGMGTLSSSAAGMDFTEILWTCAFVLWLAGVILLAVLAWRSYSTLKQRVSGAQLLCDGIYYTPQIQSPFILGIFRPKIYVPFTDLAAEEGVIAHEKAHLKRFDYIAKPLAYGIVVLHWFNPLVWAAFGKLCKDIESACDEKVVSAMALPERKAYSASLLAFASDNGKSGFCPLAFGEVGVKERVKNVLRFKKPGKLLLCIGVILLICACLFFMTGPVRCPKELEKAVSRALLSEEYDAMNAEVEGGDADFLDSEAVGEGHIIWRVEKDGDETKVYANTSTGRYGFVNDNFVEQSGSGAIPAILYFTGGDKYTFDRIEYSADGDQNRESIKEMFPKLLEWKALKADDAYGRLKQQKEAYAAAYLEKIGRKAEIGDYLDFDFRLWSDGFPAEISEEIAKDYPDYGIYEGASEHFHGGKRCVYQVETDHKSTIVFSHYLYYKSPLFERITIEVKDDTYTESVACGRGL